MNDRYKTPRIYASGYKKRKLKVVRDNQREVISQIPKLTNYFISSRQSANISKNETNNKNVEILTSKEKKIICENVVM